MSRRATQDEVGWLVKQLQQELRTHMDRALSDHDVTMSTYAALTALAVDPDLSNAELARRCFVTPQTMHRLVADLVDAGHVEQRNDPDHGRIKLTRLTDEGHRKLRACHRDVDHVQDRMLADLAGNDEDQLRDLLRRCLAGLRDG